MKLITTCGNDGHGNYAGVRITIAGIISIPIFWIDFFANDAAKAHDAACDAIDWKDAEKSYAEYKKVTEAFHEACIKEAHGVPSQVWDTKIAYFFASRWGDVRYEMSRK